MSAGEGGLHGSPGRLGLVHRPHPALPRLGAQAGPLRLRPPPACDWHRAISLDGDALGNDRLGNCVPCAALRAIQIRRGVVAGDRRRPTEAAALALYRAWAGYDGTAATDLGTPSDMAAALWARDGIAWGAQWEDVPAIAWIDPGRPEQLRGAVAFLGPVQLDLALPRSAAGAALWEVGEGPDGSPGSWGAHRVCVGRYDADHCWCITWGREQPMSWSFLARYGLNCEATVSRSWLDTLGVSPQGLDLATLERASRALAA
ncbi:conserved protein of unknown function [Rhodovastum atsumiense]|uniref:Peptidase C39-like domain-containing protein n=1 Tax=Rhodovastum atsumiense TaxID=504468 RepID=A0A5M6IYX1_9PROT|nr:hypothetical protein [Rhodovastum atsumiense]KAA5613493.1 hypothetical protein F1189_05405 [Rhodovastum atsumiense]CAH2603237.1 conserved protein of unknown function [Rhodovastum atsumiense]